MFSLVTGYVVTSQLLRARGRPVYERLVLVRVDSYIEIEHVATITSLSEYVI